MIATTSLPRLERQADYLTSPVGDTTVILSSGPSSRLRREGLHCNNPREEVRIESDERELYREVAPPNLIFSPLGWSQDGRYFIFRRQLYAPTEKNLLKESEIARQDFRIFDTANQTVRTESATSSLVSLAAKKAEAGLYQKKRTMISLTRSESENRLEIYNEASLYTTDGRKLDSATTVANQSTPGYVLVSDLASKYRDLFTLDEL